MLLMINICNSYNKNRKLITQIIIINFIFYLVINSKISTKTHEEIKNSNLRRLINKLKAFEKYRQPKYYIFSDFYGSKYCSDINAYTLFEYYLENNISDSYYIINDQSELYKNLEEEKKTQNLILINGRINIFEKLFNYLLNSKIIVQSYVFTDFHFIVNNVTYLKYLYINHGITYFKNNFISSEFIYLNENKRNIITSSPYEYNIMINKFNYSNKYIYPAGLARYDKYKTMKIDNKEKDCILISFTYRTYNSSYYEKSLYKKNINKLLNDASLISFLKSNNIDLIYIPHHNELFLKKKYNQSNFEYAKVLGQMNLTKYINKCSLLITDFSSISFAFMFQKKPVLYYLIDYYETNEVKEKICMDINNTLYFGNAFLQQESLIKKIKYYAKRKFIINKKLRLNYNSVFYYRHNICKRISKIIQKIVNT